MTRPAGVGEGRRGGGRGRWRGRRGGHFHSGFRKKERKRDIYRGRERGRVNLEEADGLNRDKTKESNKKEREFLR